MDDSDAVAGRLERIVDANRATIALVFPTVGAGLMLASRRLSHPVLDAAASSPVGLVAANAVMALPLAIGVLPVVDRRAAAGLAVVAVLAYVVETVGVATGFPYGDFAYQTALGPTAFGVPLALPLFWVPVLVNGLLLALRYVRPRVGSASVAAAAAVPIVVGLDAVLDPGAVALGFWAWSDPGAYYGVPWVNFAGWFVSATAGIAVLAASIDVDALARRIDADDPIFDTLVAFLVFWALVNAAYGQLVPLAGAVGLLALLLATEQDRYLPADARTR